MEVTLIVLALGTIGFLVYGGMRLNAYSLKKYDYEPINVLTMLIMAIPYLLIFCGFLIFKNDSNQFFSIMFSFFVVIGNLFYIKNKTNIYVAFGSIIILVFAGLLLFLLLFASSRNNDDDYYYYR